MLVNLKLLTLYIMHAKLCMHTGAQCVVSGLQSVMIGIVKGGVVPSSE